MANVQMIKGTEAKVNAKAKADGQLLFATDTGNIYLDTSSSNRKLLGGCYVTGLTFSDRTITGTRANGNSAVSLPFVKQSGDTMTGELALKDSVIDRDGTPPTTEQAAFLGRPLTFRDKDGDRIALIRPSYMADGSMRLEIGNFVVDESTERTQWVQMFVRPDNTSLIQTASSLHLTRTQDAHGTENKDPALSIGSFTGAHLELDGNEIMAKASSTTVGQLMLNNEGGTVVVGPGGVSTSSKYVSKAANVTLGTAPGSQTYKAPVEVVDSNGSLIGHDEYFINTDKTIGHHFAAVRNVVNGTATWVQCSMNVNTSGVATYYIPSPENFRTAIGAHPTITYSVLVTNEDDHPARVNLKTTDLDHLSKSTGFVGVNGAYVEFWGKNNERVAMNRVYGRTDGSIGYAIDAFHRPDNTSASEVTNQIVLNVAKNGTTSVTLTNPASWRTAIGLAASNSTSSIITATSNATLDWMRWSKQGNVLTFTAKFIAKKSLAANTNHQLGTINSGYRPYGADFNAGAGVADGSITWVNYSNGGVYFKSKTAYAANDNIFISATYITA